MFSYFFLTENNLKRASWTAAFNLSVTRYFCLGSISTTGILWLQLGTPMMYFVFWFVVFVIHWMRKPHAKSVKLHRPSSYRMSLMAHLVDVNDGDDDAAAADELDYDKYHSSGTPAAATTSTLKTLCRRFRFLRAFEFLLLFSYETLVEQALQLVNCISVGSCGRVLAEFPDVACPHNSSYVPLLAVAALLLIYAVAFPVGLFMFLRKLDLNRNYGSTKIVSDRQILPELRHATRDNEHAKFGVFFDHYKPHFWWWEIQVSVACFVAP